MRPIGRRRAFWAPACAGALLSGCVAAFPAGTQRRVEPVAPPSVAASAAPEASVVPPQMQYLYGSGEAAAVTETSWNALVDHAREAVAHRPGDSVVLDEDASLAAPRFVSCGGKPFAAVFDVDETVLLNLGAEYDATVRPGPFDPKRWDAYERTGAADVVAAPGAATALARLRAMGVTIVFNTNRSAANASATEAAIDGAGIGPARHGSTLYLKGDDATGGRKDARRAAIAARYCVVAMAGDQLGDFSDLFNTDLGVTARRAAAQSPAIAALWGRGWFAMPNPTYGTALKGGLDDVFPADRRWSPPATER